MGARMIAAVVAIIVVSLTTATDATGEYLEHTPTADATVRSDRPAKNFGTRADLEADGSPSRASLVRFLVAGVASETVISARLVLHVTDPSKDGGDIRVTDPAIAWMEQDVTWGSAPVGVGPPIASLGRVRDQQVVEVDVTPAVTGDGPVTFRIDSGDRNRVAYASRESGASTAPRLVLDVGPSPPGGGTTEEPTATEEPSTPVDPPTTATIDRPPVDDATIRSNRPTKRFGVRGTLEVDASPRKSTLLRFAVTGVGAREVVEARLRLHVLDGTPDGGTVRAADPAVAWAESTVTWDSAPTVIGPALGSFGAVAAGQDVEVDVSPAVRGDGEVVFRVDGGHRNLATYASHEAGVTTAPRLRLTVRGTDTVDTTPPEPPSRLEGVALGTRRVELHWDEGSDDRGVTGYVIERDGTTLAEVGRARRLADVNASPSTTHDYTIVALDAAGHRSTATATSVTTLASDDGVLVGAGDIATCGDPGHARTAEQLDHLGGTVFTTGDHAYTGGTSEEFTDCYDPTWGRHRARTRPSPGNHDYQTPGAAGYFAYFGAAAGDPATGWYAYDLAGWRVYALNSNCADVGGCGLESPQLTWLAQDLTANPRVCTVAYWHHPVASSGRHGADSVMGDAWALLADAGVDIVLAGHDHDYERFASLGRDRSPGDGPLPFVVGTGGGRLYPFEAPATGSQARYNGSSGVLALVLEDGAYTWEYLPTLASTSFVDHGHRACR